MSNGEFCHRVCSKPLDELTIGDFDFDEYMKAVKEFMELADEAVNCMKFICQQLTRMIPKLPDDMKIAMGYKC